MDVIAIYFVGLILLVKATLSHEQYIHTTEYESVSIGTAAHFSFNTSYITKEMDTIRWRFKKQDSEISNLILEYHFTGSYPVIELENLKRRAVFNLMDYSITINKVRYSDEGTYIVETRDGNNGRIIAIKNTVLHVTDIATIQSILAPAGTTVHLSLKTSSLPEELYAIRWLLCKQGLEDCSLIVEYDFNVQQPQIQLKNLKGRAKFSKTDYSLVIEKVDFNDAGSYIVDIQHSPVGLFRTINNSSLLITDMCKPQIPCVSSFVMGVILGGVAAVATLFSCFWIPALLKCSAWKKALTTKLIRRWMILYENEEWTSLVRREGQQTMPLVSGEQP